MQLAEFPQIGHWYSFVLLARNPVIFVIMPNRKRDLQTDCIAGAVLRWGKSPPNLCLAPNGHETLFDKLKTSAYWCSEERPVAIKIRQNASPAGDLSRNPRGQLTTLPRPCQEGDTHFPIPPQSAPRFGDDCLQILERTALAASLVAGQLIGQCALCRCYEGQSPVFLEQNFRSVLEY